MVLGVTNPYFAKKYSGWKNFISMSRRRLPPSKKSSSLLFSKGPPSTVRSAASLTRTPTSRLQAAGH